MKALSYVHVIDLSQVLKPHFVNLCQMILNEWKNVGYF
jgi:hypothetical protein